MVSKSQQKRICTQSECAYREELESQVTKMKEVVDAAVDWVFFEDRGLSDDVTETHLRDAVRELQGGG